MNQDCLTAMRAIYAEYTVEDIAQSIRIIRAEITSEELRNDLQKEILEKQRQLEQLR